MSVKDPRYVDHFLKKAGYEPTGRLWGKLNPQLEEWSHPRTGKYAYLNRFNGNVDWVTNRRT